MFLPLVPPSYNGSNEQEIIVFENDNVSLSCDIEAYPPPNIRWYFNARPLDISDKLEGSLPRDTMLHIWNAKVGVLYIQYM